MSRPKPGRSALRSVGGCILCYLELLHCRQLRNLARVEILMFFAEPTVHACAVNKPQNVADSPRSLEIAIECPRDCRHWKAREPSPNNRPGNCRSRCDHSSVTRRGLHGQGGPRRQRCYYALVPLADYRCILRARRRPRQRPADRSQHGAARVGPPAGAPVRTPQPPGARPAAYRQHRRTPSCRRAVVQARQHHEGQRPESARARRAKLGCRRPKPRLRAPQPRRLS